MKRTAPLPPNLTPWFTHDRDGVVRCRWCPSAFVGKQSTDLALALHVSVHLGKRTAEGQPKAPVESGQG